MRSDEVRALQEALRAHGFGPLTLDGVFGPGTAGVVRQFQAAQGLEVDAVVGPATWAALLRGAGLVAIELVDPAASKRNELLDLLERHRGRSTPDMQVRAVLRAAIGDIGKREDPDGSNRGPTIMHLVQGYADFWSIPGRPYLPWCAIAVSSWIGIGLGLGKDGAHIAWARHPFGKWLGGVAQIEDWAEKQGLPSAPKNIVAGDIFTMAREGSGSDAAASTRAGHTGLVVARDGDHIVTVEGNTSNQVASRIRPVASLSRAVRWYERIP